MRNRQEIEQRDLVQDACVLEDYSTESRGSANLFEVSTKSLASFSKEIPKNNNSNSTGGH